MRESQRYPSANDSADRHANRKRLCRRKAHDFRIDSEIEWTYTPRLPPGDYTAISRGAKAYFDHQFQRWVCGVQFDIMGDPVSTERIARLTWFLNLGSRPRPKAGRRTKYWTAWVRANGGPPKRGDRLSPNVFSGRVAVVRVGDTAKTHDRATVGSEYAYSVVRDVIAWQTGGTR